MGWGKGSENNNIGWGQAAGNATNNWGKSQKNSYAGQTDIVGLIALSISYSSNNYCDDSGNTPQPTVSNNAGAGTFSSTTGLVIDGVTGIINTDTSTAGSYVITYTDTDAATATATVVILNLDNAAFSYSASSFEPTDADPTPTITGLTGGTFSAGSGLVFVDSGTNTGSSTGEIDLSASTVASYTITYDTTSSGSSVCPNTSTQTVEITASGIANNYSMNFDGVNDYINVGNDSSLDISGNLTISSWVRIDSPHQNYHAILSKITSTDRNYEILVRSSGQISFYTSNTEFNTSSQSIPINTWTHIAVSVESGATNGVKFYFNGVQDSTIGTQTIIANTANLNIGRRATGSFYMDGSIDEVAIWNTALTDSQIQSIYDATSTNLTKDLSTVAGGPVYWNRLGD